MIGSTEVQAEQLRSKPKRGPRCGMNRPSPLTQAMDLQAVALKDAKDENVAPHIKAALMRAWCDLQERINELRGRGKPKPVPAKNEPKVRTRKGAQPVE